MALFDRKNRRIDSTTLGALLERIEQQYGKAERLWVMDRGMRKRQLKRLWARLKRPSQMKLRREQLLPKLGAAREKTPAAWRLVEVRLHEQAPAFTYRLRKDKLRQARKREGRYLLRTNLTASDPAELWRYYIPLVEVEEAFKNLKGDLAVRPVFPQNEDRIEAHIFVSLLAYCMYVTLRHRLQRHAPGLTPRGVLEKFATLTMLDAWFPTTDGRWLVWLATPSPRKSTNCSSQRSA